VVDNLEPALDATVEELEAALKSAAALVRDLKKAKAAAANGQLRDLTRALAAVQQSATAATADAEQASTSYQFDDVAYLSSGGYGAELLAVASQRGVAMVSEDDQLLCYPSLIRIVPADAAIEIDRRRERRLRPSVVVDMLARAQQRPPRFRAGPFSDSLLSAYELIIAREQKKADAVIRLDAIWGVLTLLPGQTREYTKPEFARDLYLLDQAAQATTKAGRVLRWHASSGTRGAGVLTTVAKTGQQQRYWGVSFAEPA
jgi:hypothetical protein